MEYSQKILAAYWTYILMIEKVHNIYLQQRIEHNYWRITGTKNLWTRQLNFSCLREIFTRVQNNRFESTNLDWRKFAHRPCGFFGFYRLPF